MDYTQHYHSPLGNITLASDGQALVGLWFDGQRHFAQTLCPVHEASRLPIFAQTIRWLDIYFSGRAPGFTPALSYRATPFRKTVWNALLAIPHGQTNTYGEIASKLGLPRTAARAVGGAVSRNPISLIVPCHRVVGSNGRLIGYAGGLDRKARLLELERAEPASFS